MPQSKEIVNIQGLFVLTIGYLDMTTYLPTKYYYNIESVYFIYTLFMVFISKYICYIHIHYIHLYIYTFIHIFIHMYVTYLYIHTYIHTHLYTLYTYIYFYIQHLGGIRKIISKPVQILSFILCSILLTQ